MIRADHVCYCTHEKANHKPRSLWSVALNRYITTDKCAALGCKCKHFEMTTFVSPGGSFTDRAQKKHYSGLDQMDLL